MRWKSAGKKARVKKQRARKVVSGEIVVELRGMWLAWWGWPLRFGGEVAVDVSGLGRAKRGRKELARGRWARGIRRYS
jgi:hypothetical protein